MLIHILTPVLSRVLLFPCHVTGRHCPPNPGKTPSRRVFFTKDWTFYSVLVRTPHPPFLGVRLPCRKPPPLDSPLCVLTSTGHTGLDPCTWDTAPRQEGLQVRWDTKSGCPSCSRVSSLPARSGRTPWPLREHRGRGRPDQWTSGPEVSDWSTSRRGT